MNSFIPLISLCSFWLLSGPDGGVGQVPSFWPFSTVLLWFYGSVAKIYFEEEAREKFSTK